MTKQDFKKWIDGYVAAWKSNNTQEIGELFTEDAVYSTGPFDEPWVGRQAIIDGWVAIGDQPSDWSFEYEVAAVDGDLGVMHGTTVYKSAGTFSNIWLIKLAPDGKCKDFREWFVRKRD